MSATVPAIAVRQRLLALPAADAFTAYRRLRARYGADQVALLESRSGPSADRRTAMIGLFPMLSVTVDRGRVTLAGAPSLVDRCRRAAVDRRAVVADAGGLRLAEWNSLWQLLRAVRACWEVPDDTPPDGFRLGFFGYFGYDTAWSLERLPHLIEDRPDVPEVCLAVHQLVVSVDLAGGGTTLVVNEGPDLPVPADGTVADVSSVVRDSAELAPPVPPAPRPSGVADSIRRDGFRKVVRRAQEYISAGDIYQVQLGHELAVDTGIDPFDVYVRLRDRNPSPYMYLCRLAGCDLVGASPELFVRLEGDLATVRPIAGTIGRTGDPGRDAARARRLRDDPKERAEHLMLVDLCRNDLGRVCRTGSLTVDEYLVPEHYSHLIHLVSNVTARVRPGCDAFDVLAAAFPAGTMTGAPKVRAMEIIEELETRRRGIYAGTVGLIDFGGFVNTALTIRTAVRSGTRYHLRASAGIVADSVPDNEWRETLNKLNAPYWAVTGEELGREYAGG